jgi:hypothetical protein
VMVDEADLFDLFLPVGARRDTDSFHDLNFNSPRSVHELTLAHR